MGDIWEEWGNVHPVPIFAGTETVNPSRSPRQSATGRPAKLGTDDAGGTTSFHKWPNVMARLKYFQLKCALHP